MIIHFILTLLLLISTVVQATNNNVDCVGCRKPAPPQCCPGTCPRCLPVSKRAALVRRMDTLPVHVRRLRPSTNNNNNNNNSKSKKKKQERSNQVLLDAEDFYRIDGWAIPDQQCSGPDCACANCVCCYTETVLYSTTVTCTNTVQSTTITTSTFTQYFGLNEFVSVTNYINFTVTNPFEFIQTISISRTARTTLTATLTVPETFTSFNRVFLSTITELGAVGTSFSLLSGGPTVFFITTTTLTVFGQASSPSFSTITQTVLNPTTTFTSISSLELFKCIRPVTSNLTETLSLTGTIPIVQTIIPTATYIDGTTKVSVTQTQTETVEKTRGCTTVKFTPVRTVFEVSTPAATPCPPDFHGCPCAQA